MKNTYEYYYQELPMSKIIAVENEIEKRLYAEELKLATINNVISEKKYDIDLISIIVPAPQERVEKIAKDATGYIYLATSLGETDNRADIKELTAQIRRVTDVPIAIGLGASNHQGVQDALKYADGFIVNATIVKIIGKCGANAHVTIRDFVKNLL